MSDLKKISAYVPMEVFNEIEKSSKELKISLSQAIIGALVKAYDLEDLEIGKAGKRVVVAADRETKEKVDNLEKKVDNITELLEQFLNTDKSTTVPKKNTSTVHTQNSNGVVKIKDKNINKILDGQSEETIKPFKLQPSPRELLSRSELASRLNVSSVTLSNYKKKTNEEFIAWTSKIDPENIGWISNPSGRGYIPSRDRSTSEMDAKS